MRVVCVHPARDPVACGNGPVHIGSAPDDALVLAGTGVAPRHLTLVADARGLVLGVRPDCQRVYVNARAVREQALLRYGDTVTLGANKFVVTPDAAPVAGDVAAGVGGPMPRAALRIVSGSESGRALAVAPVVHLGAGSMTFGDLDYACRVTQTADGMVFESDRSTACVNGWHCARARLAHGDQIVLGQHHLVVEAPGLEYGAHIAALPPAPRVVPEPDDAPQTEIWWLIAAAAVLAAVIALLLYFRW